MEKEKKGVNHIPRHIAIIMDGNGRWAKKRAMPRTVGHKAGAETFRRTCEYLNQVGVQYLTVYAFSTENWKRPQEEVSAIMGLLKVYLNEAIRDMAAKNIKLNFFGDLSPLSQDIKALIAKTNEISKTNTGLNVNICLNYGGRAELLSAVKSMMQEGVKPEDVTEEMISNHVYSAGIPDPDLVIRPGGEMRVSNFLLWQSAYSEFYFTPVLWPDMDEKELDKAILSYQNRNRRYGGL